MCRDDLGVGRGDLSDGQWAVLEPLLPVVVLGRPSWQRRKLIDGIRWRVRAGAPWRDIPAEYGPWQTVYGLFRRWQRGGVWAQVLTGLQARADTAGLITWEVNVDSTICRAHQHAAGARRDGQGQTEPPGGAYLEPDDHGLGRSRGGWTTKIHLACEQGQRPLSVLITARQRGDSPQFVAVLEAIRVPRLGAVVLAYVRCGCGGTGPTRPGPTAPICAGGASGAPSRNRPIRQGIADAEDQQAVGLRSLIVRTTGLVTLSSAGSTGSNATGPWPHGSTSWLCAI